MAIKGSTSDIIGRDADGRAYRSYTSPAWGTFSPVPMREPDPTISDATPRTFTLRDDVPRLPRELFQPLLALYFDLLRTGGGEAKEVSVVLLRNEADPSRWRIVVPEQKVGKASVRARFEKCRDLITGEQLSWPVDGWYHAGSSHSHNDMGAFFSTTDDASELAMPGLHFVVGSLDAKQRTYDVAASIVLRGHRFRFERTRLIDDQWDKSTPCVYHPDVLQLITEESTARRHISWEDRDDNDLDLGYDEFEHPGERGQAVAGRWWVDPNGWWDRTNAPVNGDLPPDDTGWLRRDGRWYYEETSDRRGAGALRPQRQHVVLPDRSDVGAWHRDSQNYSDAIRRRELNFLPVAELEQMNSLELRCLADVWRELKFLKPDIKADRERVAAMVKAWLTGAHQPGRRETRPRFGDSGGE